MIQVVIVVGGPEKGTRFRPLSLDVAKPLFPIAGFPIIRHLIEACIVKVKDLSSINIVGSFTATDPLVKYVNELQSEFSVRITYLSEYSSLGTAGGIYHFRDRLMMIDNADVILFMNGDICADLLPLDELINVHLSRTDETSVILVTEVPENESINYGCVVIDEHAKVKHYVEKPTTFISTLVSCGVYVFDAKKLMNVLSEVFNEKAERSKKSSKIGGNGDIVMEMERDVLPRLVSTNHVSAHMTRNFWGPIKLPSSVLTANEHYLSAYRKNPLKRQLLATKDNIGCDIRGDVLIDPTSIIHKTAAIGPNVYVGKNVVIEAGVRIFESIILDDCIIKRHSCIQKSILSRNVTIGEWVRVEGVSGGSCLDQSSAVGSGDCELGYRLASQSITVLGCKVQVSDELIVRNAIVLPHKKLTISCKDQVVIEMDCGKPSADPFDMCNPSNWNPLNFSSFVWLIRPQLKKMPDQNIPNFRVSLNVENFTSSDISIKIVNEFLVIVGTHVKKSIQSSTSTGKASSPAFNSFLNLKTKID